MSRARFALAAALLIAAAAIRAEDSQTETPAVDSTATPAGADSVSEQERASQAHENASPPASGNDDGASTSDSSAASAGLPAYNPSPKAETRTSDPDGVDTSAAEVKPAKLSNGQIAKIAAEDARKQMSCADWGVITADSLIEFDEDGNPVKNFHGEYFRTINGLGYSLQLLNGNDRPFKPSECKDVAAAGREGVVAGSEWSYAFNGPGPAVTTFFFWRAKGHPAKTPPAKLEAGLAAAVKQCADKGLPVNDLTQWPKCVTDIVIKPNNPASLAAYVVMLLDAPARTLALDVPASLGVVRKQVSVSNGSGQATFTVFVLLQ